MNSDEYAYFPLKDVNDSEACYGWADTALSSLNPYPCTLRYILLSSHFIVEEIEAQRT